MIEVASLTKYYGRQVAVEDLSFTVKPGVVTAFLGPNGAGKSTTMRVILGLDRPTAGRALVNGRPFEEHRTPLREIGALLDAKGIHPGRPARDHLLAIAATTGISKRRVAEVLDPQPAQIVGRRGHRVRIAEERGRRLEVGIEEAVEFMLGIAAGELAEDVVGEWLDAHLRQIESGDA